MEDNRGGGRTNEEDVRTQQSRDRKGKVSPQAFEGMNFEQQRGSYKNNDREPGGQDSDRQEHTRERR